MCVCVRVGHANKGARVRKERAPRLLPLMKHLTPQLTATLLVLVIGMESWSVSAADVTRRQTGIRSSPASATADAGIAGPTRGGLALSRRSQQLQHLVDWKMTTLQAQMSHQRHVLAGLFHRLSHVLYLKSLQQLQQQQHEGSSRKD